MKGFTTKIVHNDRQHTIEHGATHKPVHTSVAFAYADARDLAGVFQGTQPGYTYGRQVNPTVDALEDKVTVMEQGLKTICFSTGMAAIGTTIFALLRPGDHVVCSAFLFGNTNSLMNSFDTQGVDVTFVDATQAQAVADAIVPATKLVFVETIANPRTQVADLEGIGKLCADHNLVYVVDNTMTSPYLFRSKTVGASLVINSLTKYIGGHGNALGGTVTELGNYDWSSFPNIYDTYQKGDAQFWGITQIRKKGLRDFGAALSPEAAHHIAIGAETLALRMARQCDNAAQIAEFLDKHAKVQQVFYPGLRDHAEHLRAEQLFGSGGAILSFELDPDIDIWRYLNRFNVIINSTNLGDNRTLAIPVAHTIYFEMGAERRKTMGIADSLIRLSVGIEDVEDLIEDLAGAFD
ncbi:MAG: cystathionine gamma-synthase family protein [Pseudomonadaceae bacterium]|nr:cystathionine gamma-synthase family protein [Pseudomonadaceae bacterium]